MKETKEYNKGFMDGYDKAMKDVKKIAQRTNKKMKPIRETLNKLRNLR